jgi:hypothetical protein
MVAASEEQARHCYEFLWGRFNSEFANWILENQPKFQQKSKS